MLKIFAKKENHIHQKYGPTFKKGSTSEEK